MRAWEHDTDNLLRSQQEDRKETDKDSEMHLSGLPAAPSLLDKPLLGRGKVCHTAGPRGIKFPSQSQQQPHVP